MELHFFTTYNDVKTAALQHHYYRGKIGPIVSVILGMTTLAFALTTLIDQSSPNSLIFLALGIMWIVKGPFMAFTTASIFAESKKLPFTTVVSAAPTHLTLRTSTFEGTYQWEAFIDYKTIVNKGTLLYTEKNRYIWLPASAEFKSGSWENFTQLLESKVTKCI